MNSAYHKIFIKNRLTIGIFSPIEAYNGSIPSMHNQDVLIQKAEEYGFASLWVRDIPLYDPSFGDVGQMYDPFIYLAYLSKITKNISLAVASIILPFRHPISLAKSIQSINNLSQGRLILGIATGDRPLEYEAHNINFYSRGDIFKETLKYTRMLLNNDFPTIYSKLGIVKQGDLLPKSVYGNVPLLITGHSQQSLKWICEYGDGWMYYPQNIVYQEHRIKQFNSMLKGKFKPFVQSLYIDLEKNPDAKAKSIHLGYKLGRNRLIDFLLQLQNIGVNHVILNLKYCKRDALEVLDELGEFVLPKFPVSS